MQLPKGKRARLASRSAYWVALALLSSAAGAILGAPSLLAQDEDEGGERIAALDTRRDSGGPGTGHSHPTDADDGVEPDAITAADGGAPLPSPRPESRDYTSLRASLPSNLQALEPVVLADHLPLSWWSEVTDTWLLEPARQRRRMPRRCRTRGGYREHCSGPRIVPEPTGVAAAVADYFGLGERGTAMVMMHRESFPAWLAVVEGVDDETRLTFPVPTGHMGRGFGFTRTGELRRRRHQGVDIGAPEGSPIVAARGGLVVFSDNAITGYGNMVMILHPDGDSTFYAHCRATFVAAGEVVARGQRIGEVGETGFAGGPHLHFELRRNGWSRDPRRRFLRREEASAEDASVVSAETEEEGDDQPADVDGLELP